MPEINELEIDEFKMDESEITKTENALIDKDIIKMIIHEFRNSNDETDDEEESSSPPPIIITEAIDILKQVISYQESLEVKKGFNENELIIL
ncbi:3759_t:CDS:2 [Ambispora gerdemannii]|uniref:3759_t:CDS:1 n=1 Tax=Ambispora gerdemannii TaxID=144530 RepID=A0A9N9C7M7_9GLOM|nr:3759_t:CDS:2 [Ambispora gerdemannii]